MELIGKYLFFGAVCGMVPPVGLGLFMFFEAWLNQSTTSSGPPLNDVLEFRTIIVMGIAWVTVPIGTFIGLVIGLILAIFGVTETKGK
jgi:hypothetical protein